MKAPRFCEMSGNATRTSDTRQHIRNVGNYSPNERHDNTSETSETTLNKRHTVTSPKRRKRLTERAIHGNVSETSERLTESATHGNTSPKRRKRLTERETHGNTSPKLRERLTERATHDNTFPKRRERLTERATYGNASPKRRERLTE